MVLKKTVLLLLAFAATSVLLCSQDGPRFRPDDPLKCDPDQLPIPKPEALERSDIYDFLEGTFLAYPEEGEIVPPAQNINTLGEVPDSSWFTNRMGSRTMSLEELARGPNRREGSGTNPPFTIIGVKTKGITPGFTIRDGAGDIFFVKFDPPAYPQLATSTEVIATKFFFAFGYNVPENYLAFIRRDDLEISPDAQLTDEEGKKRPISSSDIDRIFRRVYQLPDGTTPAVVSLLIPGEPIGPFKYFGTRPDDPNDIIPHENRRELRGMRVFSAWTNHDDSRSINTLDFYQGDPGKGFVKHYLIDFGSCFGSGSIKPQTRRAGYEYIIEWGPILKAALTFGIWDRPWRKVKYPDYPQIGRFEGDYFQPYLWKPEYPNPAFVRMQPQDAFWAVRIVAEFTDEIVAAIVKTGEITDPEAENYLIETLIKRRDKIISYYLPRICSLDRFTVTKRTAGDAELSFRDLGKMHGVYSAPSYHYRWFTYDNLTGKTAEIGIESTSTEAKWEIPQSLDAFLMVRIEVEFPGYLAGEHGVDVYLQNRAGQVSVVGIDRR